MNNICQWQVARKTQSSTSWRPIIKETKANVVLEKHTTYEKKHTNKKKARGKVCKKELKWRTAAIRNSKNNINDTDNTRNLSCVN